jgi:5-amino-6-(5-phosphoribosylamino)uracil reductase
VHRLLPQPAARTSIAEAYAGPLGARDDRPWCSLCMVASVDGSIVFDGLSSGLSSENDLGVLIRLRQVADLVVVGAGTVRSEGYGAPGKPGQRVGVVTATGNVDPASPLFESGAGFAITTDDAPVDASIDVLRLGSTVDPTRLLARLDEVCEPPAVVQVEGGARLNGTFLGADLIDEIDVTTSPLAVGGDGPRLTAGGVDVAHRFELAQLVVDDESFVYSRWRRCHK